MKFLNHDKLYELPESTVKFMRLLILLIAIPVVRPALQIMARPSELARGSLGVVRRPEAGLSDPPSQPGRNNDATPSGPLIRGYCRTNRSDRIWPGAEEGGNQDGREGNGRDR